MPLIFSRVPFIYFVKYVTCPYLLTKQFFLDIFDLHARLPIQIKMEIRKTLNQSQLIHYKIVTFFLISRHSLEN